MVENEEEEEEAEEVGRGRRGSKVWGGKSKKQVTRYSRRTA